ncbi:MAG: DUF5131 family protein [Chloroflexi bacterium]|nr:DUF5131 family protein [Chloroflexota bacterium]
MTGELGPISVIPRRTSEPWLGELEWIITSGESGPRHRPLHIDWLRGIRDQCSVAGAALLHKTSRLLGPRCSICD